MNHKEAKDSVRPAKKRKWDKKVISRIQEQLEFYFGDVNLRKDRFLKQMTEKAEDGFIPIDVIATFNRLKVLAGNAENVAELIVKAIQNSSLLMISEDGKGIKRSKPLEKEKYNIDDLTIYVEKLPPNVSHDWIKSVFSSCGTVTYVSLPRYKTTGDIKGFAFVEFETPQQAAEACAKFTNDDSDDDNDEMLGNFPKTKGGKFIGEWKSQHIKPKHINDDNPPEMVVDKASSARKKNKKNEPVTKKIKKSKLKKIAQQQHQPDEKQSKELSEKSATDTSKDSCLPNDNLKLSGTKKRKREDLTTIDAIKKRKIDYLDEENTSKRKRKRHKATKDKVKKERPKLQVISKQEWLLLKKQYLEAQKKNMSNLKQILAKTKEETSTAFGKDTSEIGSRIGFDTDNRPIPSKPKELDFTEGVIVKITSTVPISSRKELKEKLSSVAPVAYIDMNDGDTEGHVRFKYAEDAKCVLNKYGEDSSNAQFCVSLLKEKEEKSYWEKLFADKNKKLNSKEKRIKKRGMEKLVKKSEKLEEASTHIRFGQ